MAYCNIKGQEFGKNLNKMFFPANRNKLSDLVFTPEFKNWFGNGMTDNEGNPRLTHELSFVNESGQKRTIFDFGDIHFENKLEVINVLKYIPSISLHKDKLYMNNTKKTVDGKFLARVGDRAIKMVNHYYPNLVSYKYTNRFGDKEWSKDKSIPLVILEIGNYKPVTKPLYSFHDVRNNETFFQLPNIDDLKNVEKALESYDLLFNPNEENKQVISEDTYKVLEEFLLTINPEFKIEKMEDLPANGISYIRDFLINLKTGKELQAMPEEVSHFFFELLPKNSELRNDMMSNITSFKIYTDTYEQYKGLEDYQKDGKPNIDKIKREASAKLIGEYIYAITTNDNSRIEDLTKVKKGFIKKWWNKFIDWLFNRTSSIRNESLKSFIDSANAILNKNVSLLSVEDIINNADNLTFFQTNYQNITDASRLVIEKLQEKDKLQDLFAVIKNFEKAVKKDFLPPLRKSGILFKENDEDILSNIITKISDTNKSIDAIITAANGASHVENLASFISTIEDFKKIAKILSEVANQPIDDKKKNDFLIDKIQYLALFRNAYSNLSTLLSDDLRAVLADSEVGIELINEITSIVGTFDSLDRLLVSRLRDIVKKVWNNWVSTVATPEIERIDKEIAQVKSMTYVNQRALKELEETRAQLMSSELIAEEILKGIGKDMDIHSQLGHYILPAIKVGDMWYASIAKHVLTQRMNAEAKATNENVVFASEFKKLLGKTGLDNYTAGEKLTYVDMVKDISTEGGTRQVVRFLNPHLNTVNIERFRMLNELKELKLEIEKSEGDPVKKREFEDKRNILLKTYNDFYNNYFNSPFTDEFVNFRKKWDNNIKFLEIKEEYDNLSRKINIENENIKTSKDSLEKENSYFRVLEYKSQRSNLFRVKDDNGELTEKSSLLKQYFEESQKFKELDIAATERNAKVLISHHQTKMDLAINEILMKAEKFDDSNIDKSWEDIQEILEEKIGISTSNIRYKYTVRAEKRNKDSNFIVYNDNIVYSNEDADLLREILYEEFDKIVNIEVKTKQFYDDRKLIMDKLKSLKDESRTFTKDGVEYDYNFIGKKISEYYEKIFDLLTDRNDEYGQRNPLNLKPEELEKLNQYEDFIDNTLQALNVRIYDMSNVNNPSVNDLIKKYNEYVQIYIIESTKLFENFASTETPKRIERIESIKDDIQSFNTAFKMDNVLSEEELEKQDFAELLYEELVNLQEKKPTQAYWYNMEEMLYYFNDYLAQMKNAEPKIKSEYSLFFKMLQKAIINKNHKFLSKIINDEISSGFTVSNKFGVFLEFLQSSNNDLHAEFFDWFNESHKEGFRWETTETANRTIRKRIDLNYVPRLVYTYSDVSRDEEGNARNPEHVEERYAKNLNVYRVKDEYRRNRITHNTINPDTGQLYDIEDWNFSDKDGWLPLSKKQLREKHGNDKHDDYLNKKFYDETSNQSMKDLLMYSLRYYLNQQEEIPDGLRGGYNIPVTELDNFQKKKQLITNAPGQFRMFKSQVSSLNPFGSRKNSTETEDDAFSEINDIKTQQDYDEQGKLISGKAPKLGVNSKLSVDAVNTNILHFLTIYNYKAEDYKARVDLDPLMKTITSLGNLNMAPSKRMKAIQDLYEQQVLLEVPDNFFNSPNVKKLMNAFMGASALRLMADLVGGATNYIQASINNIIESVAHKYLSPRDYAEGNRLAAMMMKDIIADYTSQDDFNYYTLLYQKFDFIPGEAKDDIIGRTSIKSKIFDFSSWLMLPRKAGELHAQSAMGLGLMNSIKVRNQIDGKDYPVHQIYEKKNGVLVLKDGFYEMDIDDNGQEVKTYPWNLEDGENYLKLRQKITLINIELQGNYAKFTSSQISRHSVGSMVELMKKFIPVSFQRRWGRRRLDFANETIEEGYDLVGVKAIWNLFLPLIKGNFKQVQSEFEYITTISQKDKYALLRMITDLGFALMIFLITAMVMGYDDDDDNRFKKLKKESQLHNLTLLILLKAYQEQTSFIPLPGLGYQELKRTITDPISLFRDSVSNVAGVADLGFKHILYTLGADGYEGDLFYQKNSGLFSQKGDPKIIKYLLKNIGYSGATFDTVEYIKNFENMQNRIK